MRRVWLGLTVLTLTGLTGCRSLDTADGPGHRSESGYTNVIRSVPEPELTSRELNPKAERVRWMARGGKTTTASAPPVIPPFVERNPSELAQTTPNGVENGFNKLPQADLGKQTPAVALKPDDGPFRAITLDEVRSLSMQYSPSARRIEMENELPISLTGNTKQHSPSPDENCSPATDRFPRQARSLAAQGDRVKSAGQAALQFYDLADAAGRSEILRKGIADFDELRAELKTESSRPMIPGRPRINLPDVSTLDSQRGQLLETAIMLNGLSKTYNVDLKRMTGMVGNTSDILYPTGDFGVDTTPLDVKALVQTAMENRPDLQLLRLAYFELNEDSLPAIREQLRQRIGYLTPAPTVLGRHRSLLHTALQRFGKKADFDPALVHEVAIRRAQLFDIICEEERKAADDVRKAAIALQSSADLVSIARTRSEELGKKADKKPANPLQAISEFPNKMEWYKARAEVINAVMTWHKSRVALLMAQGKVQ